MAIIPFHIVDAFADRPFTGNPAAVIPNATGLSDAEMLQITDELSMEAGFILPPATAGADIRLRFFTKRREAALSGHVVIAAFASMADRGFYKPTPQGLDIMLETGAGILPVNLSLDKEGATLVTLDLPEPRFGEPVSAGEVAAALEIPGQAIGLGDHGPQRVSCGFDQVVVPICDRQVMRGEFPRSDSIGRFTDLRGVGGVTLLCPDTVNRDADFHCRFFHPRMGDAEDIVSGTSLGAAAAYIVAHGLVPHSDRIRITTEQGFALGRPTMAELNVAALRGRILKVQLAATGVVVMRGSFHFPREAMQARG